MPSQKVIYEAMTEMVGLKLENEREVLTFDEAVSYMLNPETITKDTPRFSLTSFEVHDEKYVLYTMGYSRFYLGLDLFTDDQYEHYGIKNREHLIGYTYVYRGTVRGFKYVTPHMVYGEHYRGSMILKTKPLMPYKVTMLYDNGDTYEFEFKSTETIFGFNGKPHRYITGSFNGEFFMSMPLNRTYELGAPM
ncbi:hypothetical protein [Zophobihabitans entericus]|uniref:Uncharacterized protein n=1 Tax=Zophobihabitans entericus TaxID=1635327 RepID=A0A6G9I8L8_9GAMM|nr:hypothetical protein [Zophobihabitans entericus]QIQ20561.1 hypothetical protein IPMB12_02010 [Zophobihabitans entericus]